MTGGTVTLVEDVQCPACKSYKTFAVDKRLRYCRNCQKCFTRRNRVDVSAPRVENNDERQGASCD